MELVTVIRVNGGFGTGLEGKIQVMIWNTIRLLSGENEEKYELSEPKIKLSPYFDVSKPWLLSNLTPRQQLCLGEQRCNPSIALHSALEERKCLAALTDECIPDKNPAIANEQEIQ